MSDEIKKITDDELDAISGGMTASLRAAYACIAGTYGNGQTRINNLLALGLDPIVVQGLVNSILAGHVKVQPPLLCDKSLSIMEYTWFYIISLGFDFAMPN